MDLLEDLIIKTEEGIKEIEDNIDKTSKDEKLFGYINKKDYYNGYLDSLKSLHIYLIHLKLKESCKGE